MFHCTTSIRFRIPTPRNHSAFAKLLALGIVVCGNCWSIAQDGADKSGGPAGAVSVTRDIAYADTKDPAQTLDLYLPEQRADGGKLPVLVFVHGGAWRAGNKRSGAGRVLPFVESGHCAGVSIGYRLTDKAQWPAQIHDCKAAIRWIRGNADHYGLDAERIVVWGTSAGGHLVAMLGTADESRLEGDLGRFGAYSSRVLAVIDFFGPADLLTMNEGGSSMDHYAPDSPESKLVGGPVLQKEAESKSASPLYHVTSDDAAFLIMHGTMDPLVPHRQSQVLHAALLKAKVDSTFVSVNGGGHGFSGPTVDSMVKRFVDRHLYGNEVELESTSIPDETKKAR